MERRRRGWGKDREKEVMGVRREERRERKKEEGERRKSEGERVGLGWRG